MSVIKTRWSIFLVSIITIIGLDYLYLPQQSSFFKIVNAIAVYFVNYEIMLQFIRILYNDIYHYMMRFLNGNIKLNGELHGKSTLSLWEKSKLALAIVAIHLLSIIFTYFINF